MDETGPVANLINICSQYDSIVVNHDRKVLYKIDHSTLFLHFQQSTVFRRKNCDIKNQIIGTKR